MDTKISS